MGLEGPGGACNDLEGARNVPLMAFKGLEGAGGAWKGLEWPGRTCMLDGPREPQAGGGANVSSSSPRRLRIVLLCCVPGAAAHERMSAGVNDGISGVID